MRWNWIETSVVCMSFYKAVELQKAARIRQRSGKVVQGEDVK